MSNKTILILALITTIGFTLRVYRLADTPPSLYWDEVSTGLEANSVAKTGKDTHGNSFFQPLFPAYGDYKLPGYIWIDSLFLHLLSLSPFAVRLPAAVFGTSAIIVIYLLTKELFDKNYPAITAAAVTAISPWAIHFSRIAFEAVAGLLFFTFSIICFLFARRQNRWFAISAIALTYSMYCYFSLRIIAIPIFLTLIVLYRRQYQKKWKEILISGLVCSILLIPLAVSPVSKIATRFRLSTASILTNDTPIIYANSLRSVDGFTWWSRLIHHRFLYRAKELVSHVSSHASFSYLFLTGDPNPRHNTGINGVMYLFWIPFFFWGIYALWGKHRPIFILLVVWWFSALLPAAIPNDIPHALRSLNGLPVLSIVIASGINAAYAWYHQHKTVTVKVITVTYLTVSFAMLLGFLYYYFNDYSYQTKDGWYQDFTDVSHYLVEEKDNYDRLYANIGNNLFLYVMFYSHYPPEYFHRLEATLNRDNPYDLRFQQFDKYRFNIDTPQILGEGLPRVLAVIPIGELPPGYPVKHTFYNSDGSPRHVAIEVINHY